MAVGEEVSMTWISRSPHGERGLKCKFDTVQPVEILVALLMESVD